MLKIKEIYTKEEIQFTYDFIGYWLSTNFTAVTLNSENKFNESNEHLNPWFSRELIAPIKKMVNGHFPESDLSFLVSEREKLNNLSKEEINKEFGYIKFGLLLFHMAQTLNNFIQESQQNKKLTRTLFINSQNLSQTFLVEGETFSQRIKQLKGINELDNQMRILRKLKDEHEPLKDKGTAFLSLLKQNQNLREIKSSESVKQEIQKLKDTFNFQSVTIHPGNSKNIIQDIEDYSNTLKRIANKTGIPYKAIGMGMLNVSFHLTSDDFNLSFTNTKVNAMHYVNLEICGIFLKKKEEESFIHEYAHFISSLIFFGSKSRDVDDFNKYHKYSNDTQFDVKAMAPAHSLMLDWTAKTLINDNWKNLQKIKATTANDAGLKFLEQGIAQIILKGQPLNENFTNSNPIQISPYDFSYKEYIQKIIHKMVNCKLLESSTVDANVEDISIFFIKHSSYGTYNHEIKNEYLKTLLSISLIDAHTYYQANPEEIWARSFEELLKTGEQVIEPMPKFDEKNSFLEYLDAFEKIKVQPNSVERLHMLKIVERVYDEIIPNHGFNAEKSPCIIEFKKNNPNEDTKTLEIYSIILKNGLTYKGEKNDFSLTTSYKLSK